ncbi:MAG: hypothetical protein E7399_07495 [Ruminococcaceae bacterium]|nr:hypothetical protein [Oscillospiraceae bacterium]
MNLNVISFNIRCCDDPNGNSIEERAPRLDTVTKKFDADVIGFQEFRPAWEKPIELYYGDQYEMFNKYRSQEVDVESSPILWKKDKFECVKTGYFWLSDTPEVWSRGWDERYNCFRMCVYVIVKELKTDQMFTVMNTHFGFGDNCQMKSAKLVYEYSKKISEYPTFIVGDFNMTPESLGYAEMVKHFTDVNTVTARETRTTYHGYAPEKNNNAHIDYCFVDETIKPVSYTLICDLVEQKFPSDHYGLYLELEI